MRQAIAVSAALLILGAAGRDFHNFNCVYRNNEAYDVVAFTATQIPDIDGRKYPAELAGDLYPGGIPIEDEADLLATYLTPIAEEAFDSLSSHYGVEPDLPVRGLSRAIGVVGDVDSVVNPPNPASAFDPQKFLAGVLPKLFGLFELTDILAIAGLDPETDAQAASIRIGELAAPPSARRRPRRRTLSPPARADPGSCHTRAREHARPACAEPVQQIHPPTGAAGCRDGVGS